MVNRGKCLFIKNYFDAKENVAILNKYWYTPFFGQLIVYF